MTSEPQAPFPFIVGSGRCGTTLLRAILVAGGEIAIPPESHFVAAMVDRQSSTDRIGRGFDIDAFVAALPIGLLSRWGLDRMQVLDALNQLQVRSFADAIRGLYRWYADQMSRPRYGDKTPGYVLRLNTIAATLPEASFVHMIRDGRNVALSFLDVTAGADHLYDSLLRWKQRVEAGRRAGRTLGRRYLEVRYEDLVSAPENAIKTVCTQAALPFSDEMLRHHEKINAATTSPWHGNVARPPTPGTRDWRVQLDPKQAAVCSILAGSLLVDLGYEVPRFRRTARLQAEAASAVASFQARRSIHAARKRLPRVAASRA